MATPAQAVRVIPAQCPPERPVATRPQPGVPLGGLLLAAGLYAVLRGAALVVLAGYAHADPRQWSLEFVLAQRYDAVWYSGIAAHGYDAAIPITAAGGPATTNLAFFPLYPALQAAADAVLPGGIPVAALVVAWTAGLVAACGLYLIGARLRDRRTGVLLAAVWAVLPNAVVESMGYSETLFTALAAFSLYFVLRGWWLAAAGLCVLAGLTRPTAVALIAAVGLAALAAVIRRPSRWTAWLALPIAPLGQLGFMVWVGQRLHAPDGYLRVQNDAWKMGFDDGGFTVRTANQLSAKEQPLVVAVTTGVIAVSILLLVVAAGEPVPWPLLVYAGVVVLIAVLGDSYFWTKARMLIPAFPLLLPVALGLARSRNRLVAPAVLIGLAALSATYGVYLCLVWRHSP